MAVEIRHNNNHTMEDKERIDLEKCIASLRAENSLLIKLVEQLLHIELEPKLKLD